jgi:hypothetical protein
MDRKQIIINYWQEINNKNWQELNKYFADNAVINWYNTNETFTVNEFITVNHEYPGNWEIIIERLEQSSDTVISAVKVFSEEDGDSFHATSFFQFRDDKINILDEYWGDDGNPPKWRIDKKIGKIINNTCKTDFSVVY